MKSSDKKKVKIVIIAFVILLIPLAFILKSIFAERYDSAYFELYTKPHYGESIEETKLNAIAQIDKAIFLESDNELYYLHKAQLLREVGKMDEAIKTLNIILSKKPDYIEGYELLALLFEDIKKSDSAKATYSMTLSLYKKQLSTDKKEAALLGCALMYLYLNKRDSSLLFIDNLINKATDYKLKTGFKELRNYITHYKSGGIKDYLEGETFAFRINDSLDFYDLQDSLRLKGINTNDWERIGDTTTGIYTFANARRIFIDDLYKLGYKEFNKDEIFSAHNTSLP